MLQQFNQENSKNTEESNDPHSIYIKYIKTLENLNVSEMSVKDKTKLFEAIKKLNLAWNLEPDNHLVWRSLIGELRTYLPPSIFHNLHLSLLDQVERSKQQEQKLKPAQ